MTGRHGITRIFIIQLFLEVTKKLREAKGGINKINALKKILIKKII